MWAGKMHDDLIDLADWAVKQGDVDPTRIAIFGGSHGGHASLVGVTVTPDYFAAAVDYVGISDLANFMHGLPPCIRPSHQDSFYRYVGDPDDPARLPEVMERSPITQVDQITTPLLVAHGAQDVSVAQAEADNIVAASGTGGLPVAYLLCEDEGHGFQSPENVILLFRTMERFRASHPGGRAATA